MLELTNQFIEEGKEIGLRQARERGLGQAFEQGFKQGFKEGVEIGLRRAAIICAQARFGADAQPVIELLNSTSGESSLLRFIDAAARESSLDDLLSLLTKA